MKSVEKITKWNWISLSTQKELLFQSNRKQNHALNHWFIPVGNILFD